MNVIEPKKQINLVRAGSIPKEKTFRDQKGTYFVVLDIQSNYFECSVKPDAKDDYNYVWVFNVNTNTLGIVDVERMVEPVELEVIVKEKE